MTGFPDAGLLSCPLLSAGFHVPGLRSLPQLPALLCPLTPLLTPLWAPWPESRLLPCEALLVSNENSLKPETESVPAFLKHAAVLVYLG